MQPEVEQHLPLGALEIDGQQVVTSADLRFCELFSCTPEDVVGKSLEMLLSKKDRRSTRRFHQKLMRSSGGMLDARVALDVAGKEHLVRIRMVRRAFDWVAFVETLTTNDQFYRLLIDQERWLSVYRNASDGVAILDERGRLAESNSRFFELMRFRSKHGVRVSEDALIGRTVAELDSEDKLEKLQEAVQECQQAGMAKGTALSLYDRFLEVRTHPISLPIRGVVGVAIIVRDRTEERELEEMRVKEAQAHFAGMAEIATNLLHNLGNVCGSVIFSAAELVDLATRSKVVGLTKANNLLRDNLERLPEFFAQDPKAKDLARYYLKLGDALNAENHTLQDRTRGLVHKVNIMKEVIASQQAYANGAAFTEALDLGQVVEDALRIQRSGLDRHEVSVTCELEAVPAVRVQKSKLAHVLINVVKNGKEAMRDRPSEHRRLTIALHPLEDGGVNLDVRDTGHGMTPEVLERVFTHGFTTKDDGHGFGLHFCATAMKEMGAELRAASDGPEKGSTFTLHFPRELTVASSESIIPDSSPASESAPLAPV